MDQHVDRKAANDIELPSKDIGCALDQFCRCLIIETAFDDEYIATEADALAAIRDFGEMADAGRAAFLGAFRRQDATFVGQVYVGVGNADLPGYT